MRRSSAAGEHSGASFHLLKLSSLDAAIICRWGTNFCSNPSAIITRAWMRRSSAAGELHQTRYQRKYGRELGCGDHLPLGNDSAVALEYSVYLSLDAAIICRWETKTAPSGNHYSLELGCGDHLPLGNLNFNKNVHDFFSEL